nr:hypothetical protein [Dendrosporobacter quercicolus]
MIGWGGRKGRIEPRGDFFLAAGYPVGVDIEQHMGCAVAQPVLGVLDADAVGREPAGVVVPEFMKRDVDAGRFGQAFELF